MKIRNYITSFFLIVLSSFLIQTFTACTKDKKDSDGSVSCWSPFKVSKIWWRGQWGYNTFTNYWEFFYNTDDNITQIIKKGGNDISQFSFEYLENQILYKRQDGFLMWSFSLNQNGLPETGTHYALNPNGVISTVLHYYRYNSDRQLICDSTDAGFTLYEYKDGNNIQIARKYNHLPDTTMYSYYEFDNSIINTINVDLPANLGHMVHDRLFGILGCLNRNFLKDIDREYFRRTTKVDPSGRIIKIRIQQDYGIYNGDTEYFIEYY